MMKRIAEASARFKARIAGVFYLLNILTGGAALFVRGRLGFVAIVIATACYIAVTLLFYDIFKPVNRSLSLLAAFFGLAGCAIGALSPLHLSPFHINSLVFFGLYCLLIGYLIFRSTFLPRTLGALMAFGGLGWLTFLSPPLANYLSPYNLAPGLLGEGALTLWLLVVGVNEQRWKEQASAAGERRFVACHTPLIQSLAKEVKSMSTPVSTNRLEPAQHTAAKVAGFLYLFTMVTANFAEFYARGRLIVAGDAVQTAKNIGASERLFRLGTVSNLITFAAVVPLVVALYVVLKPINRNVALLAAFWRLAECSIFALITLNDFVALRLLSGADYLRAFDTKQLQALAYTFVRVHDAGYLLGLVFFGLGSTVFAYLWFKSRYIPRALAAWGILSSLVVAIVTLAIIVFPSLAAVVIPVYFAPIFIFEVTLGFWLLIKGIQAPSVK